MIKYNIYYNTQKINKRPLTKKEIEEVYNTKQISKYNEITKQLDVIDTSNLKIIKCYVL